MNHLKVLDCAIQDKLEKLKQPEKKKNGLLKRKPSNYTLRAAGSILHDFYTGIENIFGDIAKKRGQEDAGAGHGWHSELLHQMTLDIPGLRPPVIAVSTEKNSGNTLLSGIPSVNDMALSWIG